MNQVELVHQHNLAQARGASRKIQRVARVFPDTQEEGLLAQSILAPVGILNAEDTQLARPSGSPIQELDQLDRHTHPAPEHTVAA